MVVVVSSWGRIECIQSVPHIGDSNTSRNSLVALPVSVIKMSWWCCCNIFKCLNAATMLDFVFDLVILYQVCCFPPWCAVYWAHKWWNIIWWFRSLLVLVVVVSLSQYYNTNIVIVSLSQYYNTNTNTNTDAKKAICWGCINSIWVCIYPFTQDLKNQESPSAYHVLVVAWECS